QIKSLAVIYKNKQSELMQKNNENIFTIDISDINIGDDYKYIINNQQERPDPVSRWQPYGVHGASRVVDADSYNWSDKEWRGIPLNDLIIYELHIGTFTKEGTFAATIDRLHYIKELGITAVEIMPVAEFPGGRNWGYDGVHLYAPQSTYGGPEGFKQLIDACHKQGLAVILDVVYNHLGPEGNYLNEYAPFFTKRYHTPWGAALNFDDAESDGVRRYFIDNALYWLTEYHVDAFRLDAVHGIFDFSALHILEELNSAVHNEAKKLGRLVHVIAESDLNDVRIIRSNHFGGYGLDAQWSDDFHHSLHSYLTNTQRGYFIDFGKLAHLKKSIESGYVYDGKKSAYRKRRHGNSSKEEPGNKFVVFTQNHDQVANGSGGVRISNLITFEQQKLAATLLFCVPYLPMLFQGQEYGEQAPFIYFTSHSDAELVAAVRKGRHEEFLAFNWQTDFADPQAETTFQQSKLNWSLCNKAPHSYILKLYQDLIKLRKKYCFLNNCRKDMVEVKINEEESWMQIWRSQPNGQNGLAVFNFNIKAQDIKLNNNLFTNQKVILYTETILYGGNISDLNKLVNNIDVLKLAPYSAVIFSNH
ncbi:MAG: malto-oligosyltrehalose trehalohydrolase, partial [Deltaproteobacteria bacterium]|nr:malto-oligosyltrehalose trehalohydrolase [Deltaproteobacteria bacterium]